MTARISLIPGKARGHRPRLQFVRRPSLSLFVQSRGAGAIKVLVANSRIDEARPIVDDFIKNEAR